MYVYIFFCVGDMHVYICVCGGVGTKLQVHIETRDPTYGIFLKCFSLFFRKGLLLNLELINLFWPQSSCHCHPVTHNCHPSPCADKVGGLEV